MLERFPDPPGIAMSNLQRVRWLELYSQVREAIDYLRKLSFDKALSFVLAFLASSVAILYPPSTAPFASSATISNTA